MFVLDILLFVGLFPKWHNDKCITLVPRDGESAIFLQIHPLKPTPKMNQTF